MIALILEDDLMVATVLEAFLKREGWRCRVAYTMTQGRELLSSDEDFKIVFADNQLPDGRGIDFLKEAQAARPSVLRCLVSGSHIANPPEHVDVFIEKPYGAHLMKDVLARAANR